MPLRQEAVPVIAFLALGIGSRLAWLAATRFTFEDAFITFQFSRRLAEGHGFVYNVGEPIYGTTTPLFAFLLAGWLKVFPGHVVEGARILGLAACTAGLFLTWAVLWKAGVPLRGRICALALLSVSEKLWLHDSGGMETPLLWCLMMLSLYLLVCGRPASAGVAAGLLLWTRIDLLLWPVALVLGSVWAGRKILRFTGAGGLTYLPWLAFATIRFGSPVPHTVSAKWSHYAMGVTPSLGAAASLAAWMSPFEGDLLPGGLAIALACLTLALAVLGARSILTKPGVRPLWIFALLQSVLIVTTRATFEERYFVPVLCATLVLAGLGFADVVRTRVAVSRSEIVLAAFAAAACAAAVVVAVPRVRHLRDVQLYRHERSLKAVGRWLNAHTPPGATVLLEPLGYAGYFADRRMIDEVGLVSSEVSRLTRQEFKGYSVTFAQVLLARIRPDYFVTLCDDAVRIFPGSTSGVSASENYSRQAVFNPLNFDPLVPREDELPRRSCYQIWGGSGSAPRAPAREGPSESPPGSGGAAPGR